MDIDSDKLFKYISIGALCFILFRFVVEDLIVGIRRAFAKDVSDKKEKVMKDDSKRA